MDGTQDTTAIPTAMGKPDSSLVTEGKNAKKIVCKICDCCIMRAGKATLVEKEIPLPAPGNTQETVGWFWHLADMYEFENICFSKTTEQNIKYLTCADCEKGIVGVQLLNEPANFYVTTHRVKYE